MVSGQSAKLICAYVYADAGQGESTTDYVYSGHDLIAENGTILAESSLFLQGLSMRILTCNYFGKNAVILPAGIMLQLQAIKK